jgi:hypothetical protein
MLAPGTPAVRLTPPSPRLSRTPGSRRMLRRNRNPTARDYRLAPASMAAVNSRTRAATESG